MPPADVESPPDPPSTTSLEYVRASAPVTRRQFRFLLFLTLFNTILLALFIAGPVASQFIRTSWQDYKTRQQIRQKQRQLDTLLQQAGNVTFPPEQVVYEEDPVEAAKLLQASQGFVALPVRSFSPPASWQTPVTRVDTPAVAQFLTTLYGGNRTTTATLMLHSLKKPNGEPRVVLIMMIAEQDLSRPPEQRADPNVLRYTISTERRLSAVLVNRKDDPQAASLNVTSTHLVPETKPKTSIIFTRPSKEVAWESGQITIDPKGFFRFYAARLDSNDASHFIIDYALDGQRNSIDGYLKDDDTVTFVPRAGRVIDDRRNTKIWQPLAAPATQATIK